MSVTFEIFILCRQQRVSAVELFGTDIRIRMILHNEVTDGSNCCDCDERDDFDEHIM